MRTKLIGFVGALFLAAAPFASNAQVAIGVSINVAPPPIPVYEQPAIPAEGVIWVPGYWAWQDGDYYWVPGTWVEPPEVGFLWTPGWWAWSENGYLFHSGYWGPTVGFYGGINYGFGYTGRGYEGGYWRDRRFYYNRAVNNVTNVHITNVYQKTVVVNNTNFTRVSFNGGRGGVRAQPTSQQRTQEQVRHVGPTVLQARQHDLAVHDRELGAKVNAGKPAVAATSRPAEFSRGVVAARAPGGPVHAAPPHVSETRGPAIQQRAAAPHAEKQRQSREPADTGAQLQRERQADTRVIPREAVKHQHDQEQRTQAEQRARVPEQQRRQAQLQQQERLQENKRPDNG